MCTNPRPRPVTDMHRCTHLFTGAQRYTCTHITVQAPRHLWHPCTHVHIDEHQRVHEHRHPDPGPQICMQPHHTHAHAQAPIHVPTSAPIPVCAPVHSHLHALGQPGYVRAQSLDTEAWANGLPCTRACIHSHARAAWATHVHTQTRTLRLATVATGVRAGISCMRAHPRASARLLFTNTLAGVQAPLHLLGSSAPEHSGECTLTLA